MSRCGCYCVISIAWDKLREEGSVDVFHAVKMVKMNRPQLVDNLVGLHQMAVRRRAPDLHLSRVW